MSAGLFATSRRGGLTMVEIREIEAHRNRDRPTPWQALASRYGRPVEDIQAVIFTPRPAPEPEPEPVQEFVWDECAVRRLWVMFIDLDLSAAQVAASLGCTREAIIGKANRLGLKKGRGTGVKPTEFGVVPKARTSIPTIRATVPYTAKAEA